MIVKLIFVPPGGGEADFAMNFELSAVPQPGDYISIRRGDESKTEDFIVRRTWWTLEFPATGDDTIERPDAVGGLVEAAVECEFAVAESSTEAHKISCKHYETKTGRLNKFDASTY
jgi:hypothetical protein